MSLMGHRKFEHSGCFLLEYFHVIDGRLRRKPSATHVPLTPNTCPIPQSHPTVQLSEKGKTSPEKKSCFMRWKGRVAGDIIENFARNENGVRSTSTSKTNQI